MVEIGFGQTEILASVVGLVTGPVSYTHLTLPTKA